MCRIPWPSQLMMPESCLQTQSSGHAQLSGNCATTAVAKKLRTSKVASFRFIEALRCCLLRCVWSALIARHNNKEPIVGTERAQGTRGPVVRARGLRTTTPISECACVNGVPPQMIANDTIDTGELGPDFGCCRPRPYHINFRFVV